MSLNVTLANGVLMPAIGFGCAGHVRAAALVDGINAGYRLFDTAQAASEDDETRKKLPSRPLKLICLQPAACRQRRVI
eukprot:1081523-Pleurochrysis_carterae.AAC.2